MGILVKKIAIVYFNMGHAYHNIDYKKSLEYYEKCIENDDSYFKAYVNSGNIYLDLGEYEKSLKYYDLVLNKAPLFYEALINKAVVLFKLKRYDESTRYFNKALSLNVKKDIVYMEWVSVLEVRGMSQKLRKNL